MATLKGYFGYFVYHEQFFETPSAGRKEGWQVQPVEALAAPVSPKTDLARFVSCSSTVTFRNTPNTSERIQT